MARPHNSKDKNRKFLLNRLQDMYGVDFDPIMQAAELANTLHKHIEDSKEAIESIDDPVEKLKLAGARTGLICDAIDKWCKIAEFTNGKVSAITLSQDPENPLFEMSRDERQKEIDRLLKAVGSGTGKATRVAESTRTAH